MFKQIHDKITTMIYIVKSLFSNWAFITLLLQSNLLGKIPYLREHCILC